MSNLKKQVVFLQLWMHAVLLSKIFNGAYHILWTRTQLIGFPWSSSLFHITCTLFIYLSSLCTPTYQQSILLWLGNSYQTFSKNFTLKIARVCCSFCQQHFVTSWYDGCVVSMWVFTLCTIPCNEVHMFSGDIETATYTEPGHFFQIRGQACVYC